MIFNLEGIMAREQYNTKSREIIKEEIINKNITTDIVIIE